MSVFLLIVGLIGIAAVALAVFARRPVRVESPSPAHKAETHAASGFDQESIIEFDRMPEQARCEMLFSVAMLDDDRTRALLEHALSDSSPAVSLAAARGLVGRGRDHEVTTFLDAHPGPRATELAQALQLFDIDRD